MTFQQEALVKATLTHLETLETCSLYWNPESYRVEKVQQAVAPAVPGYGLSPVDFVRGGEERFFATLLLDAAEAASRAEPELREGDLRAWVDRLEEWSIPQAASGLPPTLLFAWGKFRFRGIVEELHQEWVRFDASGTPLRAWVSIVLRKSS